MHDREQMQERLPACFLAATITDNGGNASKHRRSDAKRKKEEKI